MKKTKIEELKEEHLRDLIELKSYSKRNDMIWVNAKIKRLKKELKELEDEKNNKS